MKQEIEIQVSYRYIRDHPWVVQAITGFLSAYFMAKPDFRLQRHKENLEMGMHVWVCETPLNMKVSHLLKRLQVDIPPSQVTEIPMEGGQRLQFLIDSPGTDVNSSTS